MSSEGLPERAARLNAEAAQLAAAGRYADAVATLRTAVAVCRDLERASPQYALHLATALTNLGVRLAELGSVGEAIEATDEAVALYGRAATVEGARASSVALTNLASLLAEVQAIPEALETARRAVLVARTADPVAGALPLARALNNLSLVLLAAGLPREALAPLDEAIVLLRRALSEDATMAQAVVQAESNRRLVMARLAADAGSRRPGM